MKRLITIVLVVSMALSLCACTGAKENTLGKQCVDAGLENLKDSANYESTSKALELFLKADELGDAEGTFYAGYTYIYGGLPYEKRDIGKAIEYLKKCEDVNPYADALLAVIYDRCDDEAYMNPDLAKSYSDKANQLFSHKYKECDAYVTSLIMAHYYFMDCGYHDEEKGWEYIQKGVDVYSTGCMVTMAERYQDEGDYEKAIDLYEKASDLGNVFAMYYYGLMYYSGEGVEQDFAKAAELFSRASERNFCYATWALAYMYNNGEGVEQDREKADELIQKAIDTGLNLEEVEE